MEKDIRNLISGVKKITLNEKTTHLPRPPPIKACKSCHSNAGSDDTGLCATCDLNHKWWTQK